MLVIPITTPIIIPIIAAPQILILKLQKCVAKYVKPVNIRQVKYVPLFSALPGLPFFPICEQSTPIIDAKSPIAQKQNIILISPSGSAITNVAAIAAMLESNKSAPIPATSPTLSPTLSAITAGFRGSSSGIPNSTFPVKSAAISAVLVKIPPPAFANNANKLAPKLKANSIFGLLVIKYNAAAPAKEVPTTAIPITAPPLKPAIKDLDKLSFAKTAVFTFAIVAMLIPIIPANPEKVEPSINAITIPMLFKIFSVFHIGSGKNSKIITAKIPITIASILYSFFKNVKEPSLISFPTFSIFSFLAGNFVTHL